MSVPPSFHVSVYVEPDAQNIQRKGKREALSCCLTVRCGSLKSQTHCLYSDRGPASRLSVQTSFVIPSATSSSVVHKQQSIAGCSTRYGLRPNCRVGRADRGFRFASS